MRYSLIRGSNDIRQVSRKRVHVYASKKNALSCTTGGRISVMNGKNEVMHTNGLQSGVRVMFYRDAGRKYTT
jgi:hypothetical protein